MKKHFFILSLLALIFINSPEAAAYLTTNQDAFRVNDQTALFVIDYNFGRETEQVYLPVRAARDQAWGTRNTKIGFEILKDGLVTDEGDAAGVVLAPLMVIPANSSNEQHVSPVGKALPMKFFVVLKVEPSATTSRYQVQVTDLPFYVGQTEQEYQRLNPSELQYYQTPSINLNRNLSN